MRKEVSSMAKHPKEQFEEPQIITTYGKDELEEAVRPQLSIGCYNDCAPPP